jgi:hypothetical protein
MTVPAPPTQLDRWSGGCLIAGGLLLLPGMLHPDIFETTLADAALEHATWVPIHAAALAVAVLLLIGLTGLYAARAERLGRLGAVGFALAVPGLVMTGALAWAEAVLLPVLAGQDPDLLDWNGPVTTDWPVRITSGLALLWLVGVALLGLALRRAGAVPAGAALTLAGASVAWILFGGLIVPVLAPLSTLAVAIGYGCVGAALWTGATGHAPGNSRTPRRANANAGERHG